MINGVYCELLKFKRQGFSIILLILITILLPSIFLGPSVYKSLDSYISFFELSAFSFVYIIVFGMFIAHVFTREFKYQTASTVYSYPKGRSNIFLSKLVFCLLFIIFIYIIDFVLSMIIGAIYIEPITAEFLLKHLRIYGISLAFQFALVPVTILISLLGKNMILPFIYITFQLFTGFNYIFDDTFREVTTSILPVLPAVELISDIYPDFFVGVHVSLNNIILAGAMFAIGIIGCVIYYKKADIY